MKVQKYFLLVTLFFVFQSLNAQRTDQMLQKGSDTRLLQPIAVTIGGNFVVTGSFTAFSSQRIDHFITQIFTEAQQKSIASITQIEVLKKINEELLRYPLRDILLKRVTGETIRIDLLKYRLTGDFTNNPYLMNDDVIIFPGHNDKTNFIDIMGAVNNPIKFQFVDGDKLSDAILFAGGINRAYENITMAEISRLHEKGEKEELITIKISDDFTLQRGDRIKVVYDENNRKEYKALVLGEVNQPGYVYLTQNGLPIKEVLDKSGGLKLLASLKEARLLRNYDALEILQKNEIVEQYLKTPQNIEWQIKFYESKLMQEKLSLQRLSNLTVEDTIFFDIDNQLRIMKDHKYLDFSTIYDDNSADANFLVKDGDLILIPEQFNYIYVFGQVPKVGYFPFEKGKSYKDYISKAGGFADLARDDDEVAIIKGTTKNWIVENKDKTEIEPGDFVYVPKEIPRTFGFYLSRVGSVASIVGSIATIILLLTQFGK
jgi:protein involved in polysaccharide export with SLBB domain